MVKVMMPWQQYHKVSSRLPKDMMSYHMQSTSSKVQYGAIVTWLIVPQNTHKRHPVADLRMQGMECVL